MRLLLVEDKDSFRRLLVQALEGSTWDVLALADPMEALEALERSNFEVLVTDLRLPGLSGLELLKRAKRRQAGIRIVLMSAFGEPRDIVEAIHSGADDFLPKPFDLDHFQAVLNRLAALSEAPPPDPREPWVVQSPVMRALDQTLARTAESDAPVIFLGEPGTGRARCARRLHTLRDSRAPFLTLHASTLGTEGPSPRLLNMLETGSLFIAELEELPPSSLQGLIKAMDGSPNIRWMGSAQDVSILPEGLQLRLGVLSFNLPPLRQRKEDILPLFRQLLEQAAVRTGRPVPIMERAVEKILLGRDWNGNVRELAWCVDRALEGTQGVMLGALPESLALQNSLNLPWPAEGSLDAMLKTIERHAEAKLLTRAFIAAGRNPTEAASRLGLTLRAFAQRLREHGIALEDEAG